MIAWAAWNFLFSVMNELFSIGIFLPSIFIPNFCFLESKAFHMPIHYPVGCCRRGEPEKRPIMQRYLVTWPSRPWLLYGNRSSEEINVFWWKYWVYWYCLKAGFCMLPCHLEYGGDRKKICETGFFYSRNWSVRLSVAFVSLYFFQTPNCCPLNATLH